MQNNEFRSATNLRPLGRSPSDNTFATATNLGKISSNATSFSFRASGSVGKSDNVDFYKLTISPGVNLPSGSNSYRLRNGSAILSSYGETQGKKSLGGRLTLQRGSTSVTSLMTNPTQFPVTVYLKIEHRFSKTQYNLKFDFFR
jgi:hypothetical protein